MLDLAGPVLQPEERERLRHPLTGGVILFARNYESPAQLEQLAAEIHALRHPPLLIAVDHEGGRIQRFREGFTPLPPARRLGELFDRHRREALALAEASGYLMAAELRAVGVDFSFAPVLDLDRGLSEVIGDRAYHRDPEAVAALARAVVRGMARAGMAAVGKHFPGHGGCAADSHTSLPVDTRELADIELEDLVPYERLIQAGLPAVMPAHVLYPRIDSLPAGFSRVWLQQILRGRLGFQGAILSDDLSMVGAHVAGADMRGRARAALAAGCDMVLVCNDPAGAAEVLDGLGAYDNPVAGLRLVRLHGRAEPAASRTALTADPHYREAQRLLARFA